MGTLNTGAIIEEKIKLMIIFSVDGTMSFKEQQKWVAPSI